MARSRRRRGGRTRKDGPRHPGGKLVYQRPGPTPELLEQRKKEVPAAHVLSEKAGHYIGKLALNGLITEAQYSAAQKWEIRMTAYMGMLGVPRPPRGLYDPDDLYGPIEYDDDEIADTKRFCDMCHDAVRSRGYHVLRATAGAIRNEPQARVDYVVEGLEALRKALRIPEAEDDVRK